MNEYYILFLNIAHYSKRVHYSERRIYKVRNYTYLYFQDTVIHCKNSEIGVK